MTTIGPRRSTSISGIAITALLLVVAALVFVGVYLALPGSSHYYALLTIGIVALVLALVSYLAEAISTDPTMGRMAAFGFVGMGFAVLFLTVGLNLGSVLTPIGQIVGLVILILLVVGLIAGVAWRGRELGRETARVERREAWTQTTPPSALDYAAARATAPPPVAPPAASPDRTTPPGGSS